MGRSWRCDYWISYVHYSQCDWVDTRLVIRYSNRSKGQCTNHLICFDQIKGLAVGAIRRYALQHASEALLTRDNTDSSKRCNKAEDRTKSRRILIRSDIRLLLRIHHSIIVHPIEAHPIPNNELRG